MSLISTHRLRSLAVRKPIDDCKILQWSLRFFERTTTAKNPGFIQLKRRRLVGESGDGCVMRLKFPEP